MVELQGVILFCDDIREESSGKSTIVGVYGTTYLASDDSPGLVELVGSFNGRVRGGKTVHLKVTIEVSDHSLPIPPTVIENDFADKSGQSYDEWTLRINTRIQLPFEVGAILKMTVEGEGGFRTDASLKFGVQQQPSDASHEAAQVTR